MKEGKRLTSGPLILLMDIHACLPVLCSVLVVLPSIVAVSALGLRMPEAGMEASAEGGNSSRAQGTSSEAYHLQQHWEREGQE